MVIPCPTFFHQLAPLFICFGACYYVCLVPLTVSTSGEGVMLPVSPEHYSFLCGRSPYWVLDYFCPSKIALFYDMYHDFLVRLFHKTHVFTFTNYCGISLWPCVGFIFQEMVWYLTPSLSFWSIVTIILYLFLGSRSLLESCSKYSTSSAPY